MMQFAVGSFLFGTALGLSFNVFVLIPVVVVGCAIAVPSMVMVNFGIWHALKAIVECATVLQVGYLAGSIAHLLITAARGRRLWSRSNKSVRSA